MKRSYQYLHFRHLFVLTPACHVITGIASKHEAKRNTHIYIRYIYTPTGVNTRGPLYEKPVVKKNIY